VLFRGFFLCFFVVQKRLRPTGCPASCPVGRQTIAGKLRLFVFGSGAYVHRSYCGDL